MVEAKGTIFFTFSIIVFIVAVFLFIEGLWLYGLILGVPSLFILTVFIRGMVKEALAEITIKEPVDSQNEYLDKHEQVRDSQDDGYEDFELLKINVKHLDLTEIGKFTGKAVAEHGNPIDEYAIAIYNASGTKMGYIPPGNKMLYTYIEHEGGEVPAFGYVIYDHGRLSGDVAVKTGLNYK